MYAFQNRRAFEASRKFVHWSMGSGRRTWPESFHLANHGKVESTGGRFNTWWKLKVRLAFFVFLGLGSGPVFGDVSKVSSSVLPIIQVGDGPVRTVEVSKSNSVSPSHPQPKGPANERGPIWPPLLSNRHPAGSGRRRAHRKGRRDKSEIDQDRQRLWDRTVQEVEQLASEHHAAMPRNRAKSIGAVYARYSTRFQDSIGDQVRVILEEATKLQIHVPSELIFFDLAVRGMKKNRQGLGALEAALRDRKAQVLLLFSTSRLFRKQYRTLEFVDRVHKGWGMRCIFTKSGVDTDDKKRWETILGTQSLIDQFVVSMYSDNIRAAHEGLLEKRLVFGTLSFGYKGEPIEGELTNRGKPRCRIAIDDETAPIVQQIFKWYTEERLPVTEIIRRLNDDPDVPLPPRCVNYEWTRLSVELILKNTRYRGLWRYGVTEAIYQPDGDYIRQKPRKEPLKEVTIEELRIVSDESWYAAQDRLQSDQGNRGRKAKGGNRQSRPKLLNGFFWCPDHDRRLYVGGWHGHIFACPSCQRMPASNRPLFSQLNRKLALELTCGKVAELLRNDSGLVVQIMDACRREVEAAQRPDPARADQLRSQAEKLDRAIEFALRNPGDTEEDMQHTQRLISQQRAERAGVQAELERLRAAEQRPIKLPSPEEVQALLLEFENILTRAATQESDQETAIARSILEKVTGGRITLHQQGERRIQGGWLQGRFTVQLLDLLVERLTGGLANQPDEGVEIVIDYKRPGPSHEESDRAWELYQVGMMNAEIAIELGCSRSKITKLIRSAAERRGEEPVDGRSRRTTLAKKHLETPLYQEIAEKVMEYWEKSDLQIDEIASELKVDRNTITHAVGYWHKSRGLPVPDGRTRRKQLSSRSRKPKS